MNKAELEKQCAMYALVAQMNAYMAEIEMMKADNLMKSQKGEEYIQFGYDDFSVYSNKLKEISKKLEWL